MVIPGFEYADHDFMTEARLKELATPEKLEVRWLLRLGSISSGAWCK